MSKNQQTQAVDNVSEGQASYGYDGLGQRVLQTEDIEGLLELGAPKDEYSHEAAKIKAGLEALRPGDGTEDQVSALVENVWAHAFNLSDGDMEKRSSAFRRVAREILESAEHP